MHDVLMRNLQILEGQSKALAHRLSNISLDSALELVAAESGDWTARKYSDDGSYRFLHSRIDPWREARMWTDNQRTVDTHFVIIGIGLAYHVFELFKKCRTIEKAYLIEMDEKIFQWALGIHDFSNLLRNTSIHLLVGYPLSDIETYLQTSLTQPFTYHIYSPVVSSCPDLYNPLIPFIERHILTLRTNAGYTRNNHQSFAKGVENLLNRMSTP